MNTLQGQLNDGVLANLLQYLSMNSVSGCLTVRHPDGAHAYVFLEAGRPVHISLGKSGHSGIQTDTEALSVLLTWQTGRFDLRDKVAPPVRSISKGLDMLLLEAAQQADETIRDKGILLHAESVLRARGVRTQRDHITDHVVVSIAALQLMQHLDGVNTLADVARLTGMPLASVLGAAQELHQQGLVLLNTTRVDPGFLRDLTGLLVDLVGPMGEIILEDTLLDLGFDKTNVPARAIGELLTELKGQLRREAWRAAFGRSSRALCERYTVELR